MNRELDNMYSQMTSLEILEYEREEDQLELALEAHSEEDEMNAYYDEFEKGLY